LVDAAKKRRTIAGAVKGKHLEETKQKNSLCVPFLERKKKGGGKTVGSWAILGIGDEN